MLKKAALMLVGLIVGTSLVNPASADTISQLNPWVASSGYIKVASTTAGVQIPSLGAIGSPCVVVGITGKLSTSPCGGSGAQTPWAQDINGGGFALSNAYLTATATTLDLSGVTNSLVYANGIGRLGAIATTSLGLPTFSDLSSYLSLSAWYATNTDALHEGSTNLYFTNPRVQTYLDTLSKGYFYSTTSADYWLTTKSLTAASSTLLGDTNTWSGLNSFGKSLTNAPFLTIGTSTSGIDGGNTNVVYIQANTPNDALLHLKNITPGKAAQFKLTANSNYSSYEIGGTGAIWRFGEFGGTSFSVFDVTNSKTPFLIEQNTPTNSAVIKTSGNVGFSTSSPYAKVSIHANPTDAVVNSTLFAIASSTASATTTHFVVLANGNVGIGTSTPQSNLVINDFATSTLVLANTSGTQYRQTFLNTQGSSLSWNWGDNTAVDTFMSLSIGGGQNRFNNKGRDLVFQSTAKGDIMLLSNSTGNIGIGTSSPYAKLSVVGEAVAAFFTATTTSNSTFPRLVSTNSTSTNATTTSLAISSVLSSLLKTNATGGVTAATLGTDYVNGSGVNGNCVSWGASNSLTDAGAPCGSGTGGSASQWATSTLFMSTIYTAGAYGVGIGTSTPFGALTLASSSAVTQWWNHTNAAANKRLGWMSWADGIFNFGTSSDAGATTSLLRLDGGTTTIYAQAVSVGNGVSTSSLVAAVGTSTPSGGINLTNGCYANSGVCLGTMALTGTQGQVEYFSAGNTAVGTSSLFIATSQDVGVGSTSPWAKLSVQGTSGQYNDIFSVASSSLQSLFNVNYKGYIGIGSSTPWGVLSIIDPMNDRQPGIVMATSSGAIVFWGATASTSDALGDPVRMLVGWGTRFLTNFDTFAQLSVNGEINTNNTIALECKAEGMKKTAQNTGDLTGSVISTTLGYPCGDFSYIEDAAGVSDYVAGITGNYIRLRTGAAGSIAAAGDGMGLALTTAGLYTATNTPLKLEVSARPVVNNATSTLYLLGLFNTTGVSANYAAMPTAGCGFVASTTQANWRAFCGTGSAYTYLDTGIASTTNIATPSNGAFTRFRVEMGKTYATFRYLRGSVGDTNSWVTIGSISTNYPNTAALNPTVAVGSVSAKLTDELQVRFIRAWYNDPEPY